jgi:2-polyprenyl-6-methoxyphenol hydroxylase-like FAD-dependent oxidoreductase
MPTWQKGRVGLVGDASGAVSLLAGQGGSLAIAGAALLGEILGPAQTPQEIASALVAFEQRWRPVVETAQDSGRRAASTFLPANRTPRLLRRWVIRGTAIPGIDRLVARQILRSIAK